MQVLDSWIQAEELAWEDLHNHMEHYNHHKQVHMVDIQEVVDHLGNHLGDHLGNHSEDHLGNHSGDHQKAADHFGNHLWEQTVGAFDNAEVDHSFVAARSLKGRGSCPCLLETLICMAVCTEILNESGATCADCSGGSAAGCDVAGFVVDSSAVHVLDCNAYYNVYNQLKLELGLDAITRNPSVVGFGWSDALLDFSSDSIWDGVAACEATPYGVRGSGNEASASAAPFQIALSSQPA